MINPSVISTNESIGGQYLDVADMEVQRVILLYIKLGDKGM
jgi:hypothetical protein